MHFSKRVYIAALTAVLLALATFCKPGRELPAVFNVDLVTVDGRRLRLANFADKPLLLIFWTRSCNRCSEIAAAAKSAEGSEALGKVILVSVEPELDAEGVRAAARAMNLEASAILDSDLMLVQALEIESHPALLLVTPIGNSVQLRREYNLDSDVVRGNHGLVNQFTYGR